MTINATTSQPVTPSTVVRFQPGEIVDITIRGARVMAPRLGFGDVLTLAYEEVEPGVFATIELRHPRAASVTLERSAPPEWPPQAGDLWKDRQGNLWFAVLHDYPESDPHVALVPPSAGGRIISSDPDEIAHSAHGPLTLVYRRESDGDQS